MTRSTILLLLCYTLITAVSAQTTIGLREGIDGMPTTNLAGVYQGKTLFIQNPYNPNTGSYCIVRIAINNQPQMLNYKLSAIKLDFDGYDLYTPVNITIYHGDTICRPAIINSEAVLFHTIFRFSEVSLADSSLIWKTKGERGFGRFEVEKLVDGIWRGQETFKAQGTYEGAEYTYFPRMEEGHNKYRVRYNYPKGSRSSHLYSMELDYDYYPEPVEFKPKSAKAKLFLSRNSPYEIYNARSELVLQGQGKEIDLTVLSRGQYVIYFDGRDPGTFNKE